MSQSIFDTIVPTTVSGIQLSSILNSFKDAIVSGFSGTSRPSQLQAGGYWIDVTNDASGFWSFKIFDGVKDIEIFSINKNTGLVSLGATDSLIEIQKTSSDSVGPVTRMRKKRASTANNGQTVIGDVLGEVQFSGTRDDGQSAIQSKIRSLSLDNVTSSQQSSYLSFEITPAGGTLSEVLRLINGKASIGGVLSPEETLHIQGTGIKSDKVGDDAIGAKLVLKKKRTSNSGQVIASDEIARFSAVSTTNTGSEIEGARVEFTALENHTETAQGTKVSIKNKNVGQTTLTEKLTVEDVVKVKTDLIVEGNLTLSGTSNISAPDATSTVKGLVRLTGDLSGTSASPTVPGLALKANIASPAFTGTPTAPTPPVEDNSTKIATTAFVKQITGFGSVDVNLNTFNTPLDIQAESIPTISDSSKIVFVKSGSTNADIVPNTWVSVTYGNGLFVAVSSEGYRVMTSPDGITWTGRTPASNNTNWRSVTYGNGLFVAVANGGANGGTNRVMTSFDGINWTSRTSPINAWTSVTYGNGLFVAVSSFGGGVMTSPDGITWTTRTAASTSTWLSVTYGNGLFVAVASGGTSQVMTSPDGITWTSRTSANTSGWSSVTYGNGLFVAVASSGSTNRVMTSPNGITWTAVPITSGWSSVTYGNGLFVAVVSGGTSRVMTSPDGINWTNRTTVFGMISVTYGNGLFVAVGSNSIIASPDGINWTAVPYILLFRHRDIPIESYWESVTYGKGLFVAVSSDGYVATSPDGITWTSRTPPSFSPFQSVTYGNGLFVAVASFGTTVMTSPDGITWTERTPASSNDWRSVTYGNGLFVAVSSTGTGNRVMTSPNGINWTSRTSAADNAWLSVTYGNGLFVAVSSTGTGNRVMTSPDGITWTIRTSASDNTWYSVAYGNGLFVAGAEGSTFMTSSDGITWTIRAGANEGYSIAFGNGLFVSLGYENFATYRRGVDLPYGTIPFQKVTLIGTSTDPFWSPVYSLPPKGGSTSERNIILSRYEKLELVWDEENQIWY